MPLVNSRCIIFFTTIFSITIFSQNYDIVPYLVKIERGALDSVRAEIENLKLKYPSDPNIIFLDAITTAEASLAKQKFEQIVQLYPKSKYADASTYRLFNYYIIEDDKQSAEKYFNALKSNYPESPYIRLAQSQYETLLGTQNIVNEQSRPIETKKEVTTNYTIQAAAFAKRENAISLKSQFEKAGIFSEIKEKNVAGTIFNVVYAGKFESKEDAENFLAVINSQFKLQGRVIEVGK
jgi:hypothetical protein